MKTHFQLAAVACALGLVLAGCSQTNSTSQAVEKVEQAQTLTV